VTSSHTKCGKNRLKGYTPLGKIYTKILEILGL